MDGIQGKPIRMRHLRDAGEFDPIAQPQQGRDMFGTEQVMEKLRQDQHACPDCARPYLQTF